MLREALPKIVTPLPGPNAQALLARRAEAVPGAIGCAYKACIKRGEGAMFEDVDGNIFLDWIGGVGVLNMGYTNPEVVEAVKELVKVDTDWTLQINEAEAVYVRMIFQMPKFLKS